MKSLFKEIIVLQEHLDELRHVNNVVYLQWVQDIAKEHWFSLAKEPFTSEHYWVVVKHELEYKKQAFHGDKITATTYVENFRGPFSIRCVDFNIENTLVVKTKSTWCLIDRKTLKPKRVPEEIIALFTPS